MINITGEDQKKKDLYYTKLFDKCSTKEKESGEFEECCKKEAGDIRKSPLLDTAERTIDKILNKEMGETMETKVKRIITKGMNKELDEMERVIDNDK